MKTTTKSLLQAGVHLGHSPSHWHPKIEKYIYTEKSGVHVLDIIKTQVCLNQVKQFLVQASKQNLKVLFVGTKPQVSESIAQAAMKCNNFYINQRWLGGLLTNWKTLSRSVTTLARLESITSQGIVEKLPKKRRAIFTREYNRLAKYLKGVQTMTSEPEVIVVVGQHEEQNAIDEAKCLNLRTITILDTNSNLNQADLFIPASDDSSSGIPIILDELADAVLIGQN
tara:strand:+ start:10901 stop:11578 length:678 start_codon:yes stop_codon:yes gene_type:complete